MKKPDLYLTTIILLAIAIALSIGFFIFNLTKGQFGRAALRVETQFGKARVVVNNRDRGETPVYTEDLQSNNLDIKISGDKNSYSTVIKMAAGTLAVIYRDLGISDFFSSGQNVWMTKTGGNSSSAFVTSPNTSEVSIIVDGVEIGKTPKQFTEKDLLTINEDGKYNIVFRKSGYEEQEATINFRNGYELNIQVDMFLKPIPEGISSLSGMPDNVLFINLSKASNPAFNDRQNWAKALNYWLETRGAVTIGNNSVEKFEYFFADDGKVYNSEGNVILAKETSIIGKDNIVVAYLGSGEATEITNEAANSINEALGVKTDISDVSVSPVGSTTSIKSVRITDTGIGFLRVRSGPGTGNAEVGRIDVGATVSVIEEKNSWYRVAYSADKEGWISATYTQPVN